VKPIAVRFDGGKLTSDAGAVLLRQVDQKLRLTERINARIHDPRDPFDTVPQQRDLIAQRISDEEPAGLSKLFVELFVEWFLEWFLKSFDVPPKQIVIDVDATDDTIQGKARNDPFSASFHALVLRPAMRRGIKSLLRGDHLPHNPHKRSGGSGFLLKNVFPLQKAVRKRRNKNLSLSCERDQRNLPCSETRNRMTFLWQCLS